MPMSQIVIVVPLLAILGLATSIDLVDRRIPNGLSLGGAVVGAIMQITLFGYGGLAAALLGWALCLACFIPFYVRGGMAAGDAKLMAMVGAFLGPWNGFVACVCTLIAGATLALAAVAWRSIVVRVAPHLGWAATAASNEHGGPAAAIDGIPYAAAIALGATVAAIQPAWLSTVLPASVLQ
jgi:prepilin peptidase CpaA